MSVELLLDRAVLVGFTPVKLQRTSFQRRSVTENRWPGTAPCFARWPEHIRNPKSSTPASHSARLRRRLPRPWQGWRASAKAERLRSVIAHRLAHRAEA